MTFSSDNISVISASSTVFISAIAAMTLSGDLVPNPLDKRVHHAVARAVAEKAYEQGIARADYVPYVEE